MGPRPPSVQWPAVQKSKGKGKGKSVDHSSNPSHVPSRSRRWRARSQIPTQDGLNPEIRVNPNSAEAERVEQIRKLEQAIEILGKDSPQSTGLIAHLKKLQAASSSPIGERLDACQRFVERAQKRLAAAQEAVKKAVETQSKLEAELQEGVERLQRLREEATAQMSSMRVEPPDEVSVLRNRISELEREAQSRVPIQEADVPPTIQVPSAAEINQLRAAVQELQSERDFLRSEMSKSRVEGDQSFLMSTLIDQGDSLRRGVGSNRFNPLS